MTLDYRVGSCLKIGKETKQNKNKDLGLQTFIIKQLKFVEKVEDLKFLMCLGWGAVESEKNTGAVYI